MRYYYDTEFHEDGHTIDLISIGIVAEDGREFYAINRDANWGRIAEHDWLNRNVVPLLGGVRWMPKAWIAEQVAEFLARNVHPRHNPVELWAWYGAYDHVALAQLFGTMLDLPSHVPMWTNDARQEQHRLGNPGLPAQGAYLHNALEDARHLQVCHKTLVDFERQSVNLDA